ncbi:MAG: pilus assembly protein [Nitrospirae bacterium]|nr:pilus assembly protein [Nitrospirota bacterium]
MKDLLSTLKNEKGQSAVEFALVAILLFLLVFGIMEFGRAWYRADLLKGAANIAARSYAVTKDTSKALSAAQTVIPTLSLASVIIDTTIPDQVTVTVTEPFIPVVPVLLPMLKNITLTRTATYRME